MKAMMKCLAVGAMTAALGAGAAHAGPFGVRMGAPISSLPGAKAGKTVGEVTVYGLETVPNPNPEFESYVVTASAKTGICKIAGIGKDHSNDNDGAKVRDAFEELATILDQKYGPSKSYDFLHAGALWDGPSEYAMSLRQEERTLSRFWMPELKSNLPDDIATIVLEAEATDRATTYIALRYELANFEACSALANKAKEAGL